MQRSILLSILAAAAVGVAAIPTQACVIAISHETLMPEGMTNPAEIARWQAQQERQRSEEAAARARREWRDFSRRMDEEADRADQRGSAQLALDLATSLVPPMFAQQAMISSCGTVDGPDVLDPAGYAETPRWSGNTLLANHLLASRIITALDDTGNVSRRRMRDLPHFDRQCQHEALRLTAARLQGNFNHAELVHVWARLHRLGFDLGASDLAANGPRPYRLLNFSEGRSGPLEVSGHAALPGSSLYPARRTFSATRQMRRFLATDTVAQRMVATVDSALAAPDDRCPETMRAVVAVAGELVAASQGRQRAGN